MFNHITYNWFYCALFVLLMLTQSTLVRAQDGADGREKLNVLIDDGSIESTVGEVNTSITSSAHSVIEAGRFRNSFVSLPDVMEQEVGVQIRSSGGKGSFSTVLLHGASSEQVVIYLDGIPLNDASGGPVDLSLIPLDNVERIEIYRGSTPLELGEPSIGGAVNIVTREAATSKTNTRLSVITASFQTYKLSGSSSFVKDKNRFYAGANYLQSENSFSYKNNNGTPDNPSDDRVEKRQNDGVKHFTALFNWKREINKDLETELRFDLSDRNKELPSVANSSAIQTFVDTQNYNLLGQLDARDVFYEDVNFNIKLFAKQKNEIFDDSLAQQGFLNQRTTSVTKKIGAQTYAESIKAQQHWKLLSGISQETYDTESSLLLVQSETNTREKHEASVETVSYLDEQRLILNFVLRYQLLRDGIAQTSDEFGDVTQGFEQKYQFVNPQLGVKYRFNNRTFLTANAGQYNRAPSFLELFGGGGLLLGNTDLKPEQSINTDIGYTYTWFKPRNWLHDAELYGGIFYNQIDDLIVRIDNGQGIGIPRNISDAVIQGVEATFKLIPAKRHTINTNISFIDSVNNSEIVAFQNKKLPGYYQQNVSLRYAYALKQWLYSLEFDTKRKVFYDRANLLKGDDVNLLNAGVRYLFKHSNIDFRVNNVFDENIQYFRSRPTPGLNISLSYNAYI